MAQQDIFSDVKVDSTGMQIDRNTELGKHFEEMLAAAKAEKDPNRSTFMQQILAYTEASLVVDKTMSKEDAAEAHKQLSQQMEDMFAGQGT